MDFILNGQGHGDVAAQLMANNFDHNALRPYISDDGRKSLITVNENGKPTCRLSTNATATLRKDEWKMLDMAIVKAAKPRLRLVADLRSAGLQYTIPNGMGKTVLETETQSDISEAEVSMDGLNRSTQDRPAYELTNLPLPIIHKDFSFSARQIAASRNGGSPLDTSTAELAARRVAETAEKMALGTLASYKYGGGFVYGLTNFPSRNTKSMTLPTASAWTPATTVKEVLAMKNIAHGDFHFGPYALYTSPNWDEYLDDDYSAAKGDNTLRERLAKIDNINSVRTLDYLTGFQMILVQMTTDVIREVIGMDITTIQWPSNGGLQMNYKVMAIMVPQTRADQNGNTGIVHGTAS